VKSKAIYEDLKQTFERLNYKVILDNGNFESGYCILEDERTIVINKNKPFESRISSLCLILSSVNTSNIYLKPHIRDILASKK
tara:strand:- start:227 stop:475 length:249 start_codon:yes stop_codon:yes gene_type:complete